MAKVLDLEVVTPERVMLREKINSLNVPATEGSMGILYNHAPIISGLLPGIIKYNCPEKQSQIIVIGGGFLEVSNNKVTVLVDSAERPEEIDIERAKAAKGRAEKRIKEKTPGIDEIRAEMALQRALARLRVTSLEQ
ncbi:MAG: F0F1 ATP synthase subunit epsilon [Clostridia bacterium]|nr:F0F1 ATP synthase subunit epsilon [Clostridia bacterium]